MHSILEQKTVAQIVRDDYRTADVFKSYGINYCCGGAIPLTQACLVKGIALEELSAQLQKVTQTVSLPANLQYDNWKLDFLADYIINVHHAYLKDTLPKLEKDLISFANSHRKKLPYLDDILTQFQQLANLLQSQMVQEEEVVFPYIKQVEAAHRHKESYGSLFVKTLRKPLHKNNKEKDAIASGVMALRTLTNNYTFPDNSCTNHRVIFQKLQELDQNLVQHKHFENNILLPRAIQIEQDLLQLLNRS